MAKLKLLFVFDHEYEDIWRDGLWLALELLKEDFELTKLNLHNASLTDTSFDFVLGWGGFNSSVDTFLQTFGGKHGRSYGKRGLCLGGYAPYLYQQYDILFYEVEKWSKNWLKKQGYKGKIKHAFGVNTQIFWPSDIISPLKIWDYITIGAFSNWKNQKDILKKDGLKLAVGQIQKDNLSESMSIIADLLYDKCMVSDIIAPEDLAKLINESRICFIPANEMGGGERSIWEAKSCGIKVECDSSNLKLKELIDSPVKDAHWYAEQLKEGILSCL